ncbi:MAG: two-component system response regulator BaeR [Alteromonadaceae bacterium]|nr:MAG: two-component system response regulator BaeR [Alteromonadaceae bacterium]
MAENTAVDTILIVEDEPDLATLIEEYVQAAGYPTHVIGNGAEVEPWIKNNRTALVLLDLMLPGKNGLDICKSIRSNSAIPIIITTAKVEEVDRLLGLEIGADDYICKPYSPREVVARIKTILWRLNRSKPPLNNSAVLISLDTEKLQLTIKNATVELTKIELNLFKLLFNEPGKIFSRQQILDNIYHDYRIVSDRTVDSHIKKLRKKLNDTAPNSDIIKSIYGVGYKFEPNLSDDND